MAIIRTLLGFVVLIIFSALGWLLGRANHKTIPPQDVVVLPRIFGLLFGSTNSKGFYNIRGIYTQILAIVFAINFGLYISELITINTLSRIFLVVLFVALPILEICRKYLSSKW